MKDVLILITISVICLLIIIARVKRGTTHKYSKIYCMAASVVAILELSQSIYTPYSYNHNALYNNSNFTTYFPYDYYYIALWAVIFVTAIFLLIHEWVKIK